jgi:hypothetical protein
MDPGEFKVRTGVSSTNSRRNERFGQWGSGTGCQSRCGVRLCMIRSSDHDAYGGP